MTYVRTPLKREIVIDSIITIHYFEYMKDFVFHGESHDFWELLYVDKGSVQVRSGEDRIHLDTGDIIFHEPNEFHAIRSVGDAGRAHTYFSCDQYRQGNAVYTYAYPVCGTNPYPPGCVLRIRTAHSFIFRAVPDHFKTQSRRPRKPVCFKGHNLRTGAVRYENQPY